MLLSIKLGYKIKWVNNFTDDSSYKFGIQLKKKIRKISEDNNIIFHCRFFLNFYFIFTIKKVKIKIYYQKESVNKVYLLSILKIWDFWTRCKYK